jgi:hypothetical protein
MKRLLVLVAAAFGAVALYAVTAPASQQAVTPAQFAALTKRVTTLEKNLKTTRGALAVLVSCTYAKAIPVSEYDGFVYQPPSGPQVVTTALSLTDTGDTAQYWVLTTSQACATDINSKIAPFGRPVQGHFGRLQH